MSEKQKNQLHQLLAVETDRKNKANLIINEAVTLFIKKADHFDGLQKVYKSKDANGTQIPNETKGIVTTVKDKIDYITDPIAAGIDAQISKEQTNSSGNAVADLKIGDKTVKLSATSLLNLETWITKIRDLYKEIPTLDPTANWEKDEAAGVGFYKTSPDVKYRTEKQVKVITKAPATEKFAAQTELVSEDVQVGTYETVYKSGRISPAQKARIIERAEEFLDTVKQARALANQVEVIDTHIGKDIFAYINGSDLK